jgi:hypothetical protein
LFWTILLAGAWLTISTGDIVSEETERFLVLHDHIKPPGRP